MIPKAWLQSFSWLHQICSITWLCITSVYITLCLYGTHPWLANGQWNMYVRTRMWPLSNHFNLFQDLLYLHLQIGVFACVCVYALACIIWGCGLLVCNRINVGWVNLFWKVIRSRLPTFGSLNNNTVYLCLLNTMRPRSTQSALDKVNIYFSRQISYVMFA